MPTVSIIMNCYNGERFLKEAIDSIYEQTYQDWEIIFWDNASTDRSREITDQYDERLKYFSSEKTISLGEARNLAISKASGMYIAFLDTDDIYYPGKLQRQVDMMQSGEYALCYGSALIIDENGKSLRIHKAKNKSGNLLGKLLRNYEINMQTVMVDRAVLVSNKLNFDPELKYCPDYNLFMLLAAEYNVGVIGDVLVKYRICSGSLSKKTLHLVADENKHTLDQLKIRNKSLTEKYNDEYRYAYAKIQYYEAINSVSNGSYADALGYLRKILFYSPKYIALYIMVLIGIPKDNILTLLRR